MSAADHYLLTVAAVIEETAEACSLVFELPERHADRFGYLPGQFLTVAVPSERRGTVPRSYSMSSSPHVDRELKVTVKRTAGGYGSNWICDHVEPGTELRVMRPAGTFTPSSLDGDLLLIAAGSGITPVISIVKSALHQGAGSLALIYANRDERSVIFAAELRDLVAAHPGRLHVLHWLESLQGLPDAKGLRALLAPYTGYEALICGPDAFMSAAVEALRSLQVPRSRIRMEKFLSLTDDPFDAPAPPVPDGPVTKLQVELDGERYALDWPADTRLLDLLLANGLDAPYSCRQGQCSACACRLLEGEVTLAHNEVLEPEDLAEGLILACQSHPTTRTAHITYQ